MHTISRPLRRGAARLALLSFLCGCGESPSKSRGDDEASPSGSAVPNSEVASAVAATPSPAALSQPTWFYRIDLARDAAGTLSVRGVSAVKSGVRPTPGFSGDYWAVAHAGDDVNGAVPLLFPTEGEESVTDADGNVTHTTFELSDSTASAFVEATGVDRVTIMNGSGVDVLEIPQASLPPLTASKVRNGGPPIETRSITGFTSLRERYSPIRFLGAGDDAELPSRQLDGGTVLTPSPAQIQVLDTALSKLTPALLGSIHTLSVVQWPSTSKNSGNNGLTAGANIALNADEMLNTRGDDPNTPGSGMVRTIVHESAHCFHTLQDHVAANDDTSTWPEHVVRDAAEIIEQYRLALGIEPVWSALHQSGVEEGIASNYLGDAWKTLPSEDAARAMGFATKTGAKAPYEDFAETVATGTVKPTDRGICHNFTGKNQVAPEIAIPYAKLVFVSSLGALSAADFSSCVGSAEFTTKPGIEMNGVLFDQDNHAQTIEINGLPYFAIDGKGPNTYQLLIRLALPTATTSPLGLHRLDTLTLTQVGADGRSEVLLGNDDQGLNRGTAWGMVLVTEASEAQTRGAILGLILHNGFGGYTDYVPFGTFQIF